MGYFPWTVLTSDGLMGACSRTVQVQALSFKCGHDVTAHVHPSTCVMWCMHAHAPCKQPEREDMITA